MVRLLEHREVLIFTNLSDGLAGELYIDEGWIAKYSSEQ